MFRYTISVNTFRQLIFEFIDSQHKIVVSSYTDNKSEKNKLHQISIQRNDIRQNMKVTVSCFAGVIGLHFTCSNSTWTRMLAKKNVLLTFQCQTWGLTLPGFCNRDLTSRANRVDRIAFLPRRSRYSHSSISSERLSNTKYR